MRHCPVDGREAGFSARRDERRCRPALVRKGNFDRGSSGGLPVAGVEVGGTRRDLALGSERKPGQVWAVGGPVRAKIWGGLLVG